VASDEPLCIATLLNLDPACIPKIKKRCRQERMAEIWKLVAHQSGGRFLARVIFYNDQPLGLASLGGWRWAPKSLLPALDTGLTYVSATARFAPPGSAADMGTVTDRGLRVVFPGMRITMRAWPVEHACKTVWPWSLVTRHVVESNLFCRNKNKKWFTLADQIRGERISGWSWEEWTVRDDELLARDLHHPGEGNRPSQPIFNELLKGDLALIRDTKLPASPPVYLLARLQGPYELGKPLHVNACLPVVAAEVSETLWPGLDILQRLAAEVYGSEINRELLDLLGRQEGGGYPDDDDEECRRVLKELRKEMQRAAEVALGKDKDGLLERVTQEYMGDGRRDDVWKTLLFQVPFDLSAEDLPDDQVWVVDRPYTGNGLCGDECCEPPRPALTAMV
jgi:hypothetical protein